MKKLITLSVMAAIAMNSIAQTSGRYRYYNPSQDSSGMPVGNINEEIRNLKLRQVQAGNNFQNYSRLFYGGVVCQLAGGIGILTGSSQNNADHKGENGNALLYAGIGLCFVGFILELAAHGKIGKAGRILNGSNGIIIPVNPSKHRK